MIDGGVSAARARAQHVSGCREATAPGTTRAPPHPSYWINCRRTIPTNSDPCADLTAISCFPMQIGFRSELSEFAIQQCLQTAKMNPQTGAVSFTVRMNDTRFTLSPGLWARAETNIYSGPFLVRGAGMAMTCKTCLWCGHGCGLGAGWSVGHQQRQGLVGLP